MGRLAKSRNPQFKDLWSDPYIWYSRSRPRASFLRPSLGPSALGYAGAKFTVGPLAVLRISRGLLVKHDTLSGYGLARRRPRAWLLLATLLLLRNPVQPIWIVLKPLGGRPAA